jgi:hypothetical protein
VKIRLEQTETLLGVSLHGAPLSSRSLSIDLLFEEED